MCKLVKIMVTCFNLFLNWANDLIARIETGITARNLSNNIVLYFRLNRSLLVKQRLFPNIVILALLMLLTCCERRPLEELKQGDTQIPIKIYWDKAEVLPKNTTILFYDENGNLYKEWQSASQVHYTEGSVVLSAGRYTAVVFNELRDQIDNVQMRNWNQFNTFEAVGVQNLHPVYNFASRDEAEFLIRQPGILSACIKNFIVEGNTNGCAIDDPANNDYFALSDLHPTRKSARINLIIHVNGLNNARMPVVAELRNIAFGYIFSTDWNTLLPVAMQFTVNNRTYNQGSATDGSVWTTVNAFGIPGERYHIGDNPDYKMFLDIAFMLVDAGKTIVEYSVDVTDLFKITVDQNEGVTINIEVEIGRLPDVKPVNGDSGFDTELADWDRVIIPLQQ